VGQRLVRDLKQQLGGKRRVGKQFQDQRERKNSGKEPRSASLNELAAEEKGRARSSVPEKRVLMGRQPGVVPGSPIGAREITSAGKDDRKDQFKEARVEGGRVGEEGN